MKSSKIKDNINYLGNIIITDDDPNVCAELSDFLKNEGFGVYVCRSVSELMTIEYDDLMAVLIDLNVEGGSGLQAVELIRQRPAGMNVPIIICSDIVSADDIIRGLNAGADDYMLKPYSTRELLGRIHALMRRFGTM